MQRYCLVAILVAGIWGLVEARDAHALVLESKGNAPYGDDRYGEWTGLSAVVNDKSRVYTLFDGSGGEVHFFKGTTTELNAALLKFAEVPMLTHIVALQAGPAKLHSFDKQKIACNWQLTLPGAWNRGRAPRDLKDKDWKKDPVLTVYVGGGVNLNDLKFPAGVELRSKSVRGRAAAADSEQQKIDAFLKLRNGESTKR